MNYTGTIVIVLYCRAHDDKGMELANAHACNPVAGASAKKERKKTIVTESSYTYTPARRNTPVTAIFRRRGICSFQIIGHGMMMMRTSRTIVDAADI